MWCIVKKYVDKCYDLIKIISGNYYPQIARLKGHILLGQLFNVIKPNGTFEVIQEAAELEKKQKSGKVYYWVGNQLVLLVINPIDIRQILIHQSKNTSRELPFQMWNKIFGEFFFIRPDEKWRTTRKMLKEHVFYADSLHKLNEQLHEIVDNYLSKIEQLAKTEQVINLDKFLAEFTLDIAGKMFMNCPNFSSAILEKIPTESKIIGELLEARNQLKWKLPTWLRKLFFRHEPTDFELEAKRLRSAIYEAIYAPNEYNIRHTFNLLFEIWKCEGYSGTLQFEQILPVLASISAIGADTIKSTGQFLLKVLATHPEVEQKLHQEISSLKDKSFTIDDLNKLKYLDMVIKETMRLYPAAGIIVRDVTQPFTLRQVDDSNISSEKLMNIVNLTKPTSQDLLISKNTLIIVSPFITHHLEEYWPDSNKFIPERFADETLIPKGSYIPFGVGQQDCIGKHLAMNELKLLIVSILLRYRVTILNKEDFDLSLRGVSLQPKTPPLVRFVALN